LAVTEKALTLHQRTNKGAKERLPTDVGRLSITTYPILSGYKGRQFFLMHQQTNKQNAKKLLKNW
jgi:hypothetical protein